MNFNDAMAALLKGQRVSYGAQTLYVNHTGEVVHAVSDEFDEGDLFVISKEAIVFKEFKISDSIPELNGDELYAYRDVEKNRWVSTTQPAKHKAAGREVAVFVHDGVL